MSEGSLGELSALLNAAAVYAIKTGIEQINERVLAAIGLGAAVRTPSPGRAPCLSMVCPVSWPIHCKPYDEEVLSSWVSRLSWAYGTNPALLYRTRAAACSVAYRPGYGDRRGSCCYW